MLLTNAVPVPETSRWVGLAKKELEAHDDVQGAIDNVKQAGWYLAAALVCVGSYLY